MTRDFDPERSVPAELLDDLVDLASRAPSAGKAQGWHLVVLEGGATSRFWDVTLPPARRAGFAWPGLLSAPVIALALADPGAYVARYAEPDKATSGLGRSVLAWPAPYWLVDTSFAVMTLLLAAEASGLGALFFGVFQGERDLRAALGVPVELQLIGAIALGWPPAADQVDGRPVPRPGRSASRPRRRPGEIIHRGGW
jgi:nitroreductase